MPTIFLDSVQCRIIGIKEKRPPQDVKFSHVLDKNRIHSWSARYSDLEPHFRFFSDVISLEEQKTSSTFKKSADTRRYVLRHGLLRSILAHYINHNPEMIPLQTGMNGKPELDPKGGCADVSFNMSHTSEMVLIGVTGKRRIGVDIVKMDPFYRFHDSADYILTPAEKTFLQTIEPAKRYQVFFRIWAVKEAILKATAATLSMMEKTDVSKIVHDVMYSPDYSMKHLDTPQPFFIWQFTGGSGHLGAIAVDSENPL